MTHLWAKILCDLLYSSTWQISAVFKKCILFLDILICSCIISLSLWNIMSLFFWPHCEACEILAPRPGIEPVTLHGKHTILTTGPLGKSLHHFLIKTLFSKWYYSIPLGSVSGVYFVNCLSHFSCFFVCFMTLCLDSLTWKNSYFFQIWWTSFI